MNFKKFISLTAVLIISGNLFAQNPDSCRQSSYYTYIFKITNNEAERIYKKGINATDSNFLHTIVDSFPTGETYNSNLDNGHYIKAYTIRNKLYFSLTEIQDFNVQILNNTSDLILQVFDNSGKIISDAEISLKKKKLKYDKDLRAYTDKKSNKKGLLKVKYKGLETFYFLNRQYNNSRLKRISRKIIWGTPLHYLWRPIKYPFAFTVSGVRSLIKLRPTGTFGRTYYFFRDFPWRITNYYNRLDDKLNFDNRYTGYFVTNKPKYKPGDTVKFKAFIVNKKNGNPLNKELSTFLSNSSYSNYSPKKLFELNPYDKGAYTSEFILHDSLNIKTDKSYRIMLNKKNNKYKTALSGTFRYEDYELKSNSLTFKTDKKIQYRSDDLKITLKGTDENELNLQDARYEVYALNKGVKETFDNYVFVPDTLFKKEGILKPSGETEIILSDSIFPKANFTYRVKVVMHTSDNERTDKSKSISYFYEKKEIKYQLIKDSIYIWYEKNGLNNDAKAEVYFQDIYKKKKDELSIELPATVTFNPYFPRVIIKTNNIQKQIDLSREPSGVKCYFTRDNSSLTINIKNDRNLKYDYFLYKHNKKIASGHIKDSLKYYIKHPHKKAWFVSLQYMWGGKIKNVNYESKYNTSESKKLNIKLIQPNLIFPGQKSNIKIAVTDDKGKPIQNTDITAYSFTKKFHAGSSSLPDFSKYKTKGKSKELINTFSTGRPVKHQVFSNLNYTQWKKIAGLDTMEYYKFIYPKGIYKAHIATNDSITQFAPYVLKDGNFQKIHVVYADAKPVYFSWMSTQNPYSFKIDSGYHRIKLRLTDTLIVIDSIYFKDKQKTIFSLNKYYRNENIKSWAEGKLFSGTEKNYLRKYIFPYRYTFGKKTDDKYDKFAYIEQKNNIIPLRPVSYRISNLAGPVQAAEKIHFQLLNGFKTDFDYETGFQYELFPNILKMRCIGTNDLFPYKLYDKNGISTTSGFVLKKKDFEEQYKKYLKRKRITYNRYYNPTVTTAGKGTLIISINLKDKIILNSILLKTDDEKFIRVYPGQNRHYYDLDGGCYKLIFLLNDTSYFEEDSVFIRPNGETYIHIKPEKYKKDNFVFHINELIDSAVTKVNTVYTQDYEKKKIYETYRNTHQYSDSDGTLVSGYVTDEAGEPLPGVSVLVKGTTYGTMTLADGSYSIMLPYNHVTLIFSYIGMETQERQFENDDLNNIRLMPSSENIEEVVVTALGISRKNKAVGYTVTNALSGKIAGVNISNTSGAPGASPAITIRGVSSLNMEKQPLIIINGVPFKGNIKNISPDLIQKIEILKNKEAIALYGSRASNGVLLISLKTGIQMNKAGNITKISNGNGYDNSFFSDVSKVSALRTNFSDYAFWKPKLKTDKNGTAEFEVTFPDDITSWTSYVLAMNGKKQSGKTSGTIKSYKPLSARLFIPRFLISGDTAFAIGKSLNYLPDSTEISIEYNRNDKLVFKKDTLCKTVVTDTLAIFADAGDTLKIKYLLRAKNGYFDGELRKIPVFPQGLERTEGNFSVLDKDTVLNLVFNKKLGEVTLYAQTDALEILGNETGHLMHYMHNCNEQMASKLLALLADEEICAFKNKNFKYKPQIRKLIRKLSRNQNKQGLWGWWGKTSTGMWITHHVVEALLKAEKQGYNFKADKKLISDSLEYLSEHGEYLNQNITYSLRILKMLDADVNYKYYVEQIEKSYKDKEMSFFEKLRLTELKQFCGLQYDTNWLDKYKKTTFFGHIYFSNTIEEPDNPFSKNFLLRNNVQASITAYNILRNDSNTDKTELLKMRNYFFGHRNTGYWRNTYESSNIIEALLPDLLNDEGKAEKEELKITGSINKTVTEFPFSVKINAGDSISVSKKGTAPIYLTSFQRYWESRPEIKENNFILKSHFNTKDSSDILKAGEKVKLIVQVEVKKDADFVMLDIPIPGGCSYASKGNYFKNEIHREYRKQKTNIYCQKLSKGNYTFEIELLPRYTGKYTLNPAKAELMYYPTFNANNSSKKIHIISK